MNKILTPNEISQFQTDGAILLKDKFDISWIKKLQKGIERDIKNPSPRFKSHTTQKGVPAYFEDYWTWHLICKNCFRTDVSKKNKPCNG